MTLRKFSIYLLAPAFVLFACMLFGAQSADAATYYYVGTTNNYNANASWHSSDKACDDAGDGSVPTTADTIKMGGSCDTSFNTPVASTVLAAMEFETGYTGTVTQSGELDVTGALW